MKHHVPILLLVAFFGCTVSTNETPSYPIASVNLNRVKLTDSFWLPVIEQIQKKTISYAIGKCAAEGRMDNFLIAGGVLEGKTRGQMPFDDTDLYKIIEGASYSLVSHPDPELENRIDSLISIIAIGQEDDGYLTTYKTIDTTYAPAHWCPAGGRWNNLACSHELYNSGHLFEAAAAHHWATGKDNFLTIATKNADLLVSVFLKGDNPDVPGHQIVETGLVKLYQITGKKEYLDLAKHFLDNRGNSALRPIWGPYNQDHLPVTQQDEVVGHAVRAVYMYAGMTDIAALYNDEAYRNAVFRLWDNMVTKKTYLTGGIGARHDGEAFGDNYELPNLTAYSETCAAIGSVLWNHKLFLLTGDAKYLDVLERTLYNGVLPGIALDGENFFYPNPLES
ncbi:MAG TPA: glycoside hydrolase family 127 protein, partial [Prolixibacteraceae bacterium]|nr:glycoside hydrolase family 127 protein [Prolixibacteraceae bacterium]